MGPQIRLLNFAIKKSLPTLSLPNLSASVVETVSCRQNSWLYGVFDVRHHMSLERFYNMAV